MTAPSTSMPDLRLVSAKLKAQGARGLQREMNVGLRSATVFLEAAVREAAGSKLPQSGGLAQQQATQEIRVTVLAGGVRMRTVTRGSMQTDKGFVRHPVFGEWLKDQESQSIPEAAGWWSVTLAERAPLATPMIAAEVQMTLSKLSVAA